MPMICRKIIFFVLFVLGMQGLQAAHQRELFYRNFWHPNYHGQRLNYCTIDGKQCGMAVATRYCQLMGYLKADQQVIANNIGLTNFLDAKARCKGWRCNGFKTIRCVAAFSSLPPKPYHFRFKHFVYPRFDYYRVDWCYDGKSGCGRKAAYSFCRRMGYLDTRHFLIERQVAATKAIGNQKLCFGNSCKGFKEISCYR